MLGSRSLHSILGLAARLIQTLRPSFHYCFLTALVFHLIEEHLGGRFAVSFGQHFTQAPSVKTYSHTIGRVRLCGFATHLTISFHSMGEFSFMLRLETLQSLTADDSDGSLFGHLWECFARPFAHELHQLRNSVRMTDRSSSRSRLPRLLCFNLASAHLHPWARLLAHLLGKDWMIVPCNRPHTRFWSRDSMNPRLSPNGSSITPVNSSSRMNSSLKFSHTPRLLTVTCPSAIVNTTPQMTCFRGAKVCT